MSLRSIVLGNIFKHLEFDAVRFLREAKDLLVQKVFREIASDMSSPAEMV